MKWLVLTLSFLFVTGCDFFKSWKSQISSSKAPTIAVLYTFRPPSGDEEFEDLVEVSRFAKEQFNLATGHTSPVEFVGVDDADNPSVAEANLQKLVNSRQVVAIVGPLYSRVAMGLKPFIARTKIPMVSIFATHNELTKTSSHIFRICASNSSLVKAMAEHLTPMVQKNNLNIVSFKDISDEYSIDLADNFRQFMSQWKENYKEVSFRGLAGIDGLRDLSPKIWNPTKKDLIFLPTRDLIAGKILAAMETDPYLVAAIDTVNFLPLMERIKPRKTHIRLITTSQWVAQKSTFSQAVEAAYQKKFRKAMTISSALTFDATLTALNAYNRSLQKNSSVSDTLRDGSSITGVTGTILLGTDGERQFSSHFFQEEFIK